MSMHPDIDSHLEGLPRWREELTYLRSMVLDTGLTEVYKWKQPCYTFQNKNIVILGAFKEYCSLSFFKGVLLKDTAKILVAPSAQSQSTRLMKFISLREIKELEATAKTYIYEAMEVEKSGVEVNFDKSKNLTLPIELLEAFDTDIAFKKAFESLTPGRQRAYNLHFTSAKQSATRTSRIEKYKQRILNGIGINDCTCGLSKRKPNCDGSHKLIQ